MSQFPDRRVPICAVHRDIFIDFDINLSCAEAVGFMCTMGGNRMFLMAYFDGIGDLGFRLNLLVNMLA